MGVGFLATHYAIDFVNCQLMHLVSSVCCQHKCASMWSCHQAYISNLTSAAKAIHSVADTDERLTGNVA